MGTWGTGIYSNDIAEDVKDACEKIYAFDDVEIGNKKIFHHFNDIINQEFVDNEYASFWYALADWKWKHGMLDEYVKEKALTLLDSYAGLNEWDNLDNKYDVKKRRKVLEALKKQLSNQQKEYTKPKVSLSKPKHKIGDIVIFRATEYIDEFDSTWHITDFCTPFMFCNELIKNSSYENINGYDVHNMYMAVLCVDIQKKVHSEFNLNIFDEESVYVWYDYLSNIKPNIELLSLCGFLPMLKWKMSDYNRSTIESISWIYKFTLPGDSFKSNSYIDFEKEKYNVMSEANRFNKLLSFKNYSKEYYKGDSFESLFYTVFEEKNRLELIDKSIDNLLDPTTTNPELVSSAVIDSVYSTYMKNLFDQSK